VLQRVAVEKEGHRILTLACFTDVFDVLQRIAVCCSVLQCVAVCCSTKSRALDIGVGVLH